MKIDIGQVLVGVKGDIEVVIGAFREKGAGHFSRPLVVAILLLLGSYSLVYKPPQKKLRVIDAKIQIAMAVSQYAEDYKSLRDRLSWAYGQLPRLEDRENWLFKALVDSLRAENIVAEQLPPMTESEGNNLLTQQATMGVSIKFMEAIRWLHRIESGRPMIHIAAVDLSKRSTIGMVDIRCQITTVIPKQRFDR